MERLLERFGLDIYGMQSEPLANHDLFCEGMTVKMRGRKNDLFAIGTVSAGIKAIFDLKADVYFLEMDFQELIKSVRGGDVAVTDLPRYPEVKRDLALLVDKSVTFAALREIAFSAEKKMLKNVSLFDVYEGGKLPEGKKSYALGFVLRDEQQTLTDQIIDRVMGNLIARFEEKAGATIR